MPLWWHRLAMRAHHCAEYAIKSLLFSNELNISLTIGFRRPTKVSFNFNNIVMHYMGVRVGVRINVWVCIPSYWLIFNVYYFLSAHRCVGACWPQPTNACTHRSSTAETAFPLYHLYLFIYLLHLFFVANVLFLFIFKFTCIVFLCWVTCFIFFLFYLLTLHSHHVIFYLHCLLRG